MDYYKKFLSSDFTIPEDRSLYSTTDYWMMVSFLLNYYDNKNFFKKSKTMFPNLTYPFISWVNSHEFSSWDLIEFGSGDSTLYFASCFKQVYSFETSKKYYDIIRSNNIKNVNIELVSTNKLEQLEVNFEVSDNTIAIVDSACNRFKLIKNLILNKPINIIVLDNSDNYKNTCSLLNSYDYKEIPFWGLKQGEHFESCTSVFIRDFKKHPNSKLYRSCDHRIIPNNLWDRNV